MRNWSVFRGVPPLEESKMKRFLAAFGLLVAFVLAGVPASAQSTGTVRGKIVDDKGQPVQDVVVLLEFQGGMTRKNETKSNKKGEYAQVGLNPGAYKITVGATGTAR